MKPVKYFKIAHLTYTELWFTEIFNMSTCIFQALNVSAACDVASGDDPAGNF